MRVRPTVNVQVWNDTAMLEALFAPSADGAVRTLDTYKELASGKHTITDDFTLPLGNVTVPKGLIIRASADINISIDGGGEIPLRRPVTTGTTKATEGDFYLDGTFTSVDITLPEGTTTADVIFACWGDP